MEEQEICVSVENNLICYLEWGRQILGFSQFYGYRQFWMMRLVITKVQRFQLLVSVDGRKDQENLTISVRRIQ